MKRHAAAGMKGHAAQSGPIPHTWRCKPSHAVLSQGFAARPSLRSLDPLVRAIYFRGRALAACGDPVELPAVSPSNRAKADTWADSGAQRTSACSACPSRRPLRPGTIFASKSSICTSPGAEQHQMRHQLAIAPLVLLTVSLLPGCAGQRDIKVDIERDGVVALHTEFGVSDSLNSSAIWNTLQGQSFTAINPIKPEPEDPLKAVLRGKLRMVITHVDNELASAKIKELRIVRDSDSSDQWKLAPGEVKRTSLAAGL